MDYKKVYIVIPAYNEWEKISFVIDEIKAEWFENIIVVNDWSTDSSEKILAKSWVIFATHWINRWAWAATQTGLELARFFNAEMAITIDADGQHFPKDIKSIVEAMRKHKVDIVIWSRFVEKRKMPFMRKIFNRVGNVITWIFFGTYVSDSQSWLKGFSADALEKIYIESNWFEFCSEIIQKIHILGLSFKEIPISIRYTEYSQSKWQNLYNWFITLWKLALHSIMREKSRNKIL